MSHPEIPHLRGAVDLSSLANKQTVPNTGSGIPIPVPSLVLEGNDQNFTAILDLSNEVPVIAYLWAEGSPESEQLSAVLNKVIAGFGGRLLLATVNASESPQLVQAFQAESTPTVAAVIAGRPLPLFAGAAAEEQIINLFEQVLELAAQNNVVGMAQPQDSSDVPQNDVPPAKPVPAAHQAAYEAAERGDYPAAIEAWEKVLTANPADSDAQAGLAQIKLLHRLQGKTLAEVREVAAAHPSDISAQMDVADLDISGGHIEDAFARLLDLFPGADADDKNTLRTRLLELFEVVGVNDPVVNAARARLTNLLY